MRKQGYKRPISKTQRRNPTGVGKWPETNLPNRVLGPNLRTSLTRQVIPADLRDWWENLTTVERGKYIYAAILMVEQYNGDGFPPIFDKVNELYKDVYERR